jgi:hypothetical protein
MIEFAVTHRFAPRPVRSLGIAELGGWRLKHYAVHMSNEQFDVSRFAHWEAAADTVLPSPAITASRPGVGFVIMHQGRGADYLPIAWWDNENEMPLRVFVRDGGSFRLARAGESVCVWDIGVIAHERDAYIRHVLTADPDVDAYLRCFAPECSTVRPFAA